jgi:hypothetical protein
MSQMLALISPFGDREAAFQRGSQRRSFVIERYWEVVMKNGRQRAPLSAWQRAKTTAVLFRYTLSIRSKIPENRLF